MIIVIYTFVLLYYTFLCRLPVPVAADDTGLTQQTAAEPSLWEKFIQLFVEIWGIQPDGTLAGGGVGKAMAFNILHFIPCGYLTALWLWTSSVGKRNKPDTQEAGRKEQKRRDRVEAALICTVGVNILIESLQEITGLSIADIKDIVANCIGSVIGIVMVMGYEHRRVKDVE